jgi:hypothetical protein
MADRITILGEWAAALGGYDGNLMGFLKKLPPIADGIFA